VNYWKGSVSFFTAPLEILFFPYTTYLSVWNKNCAYRRQKTLDSLLELLKDEQLGLDGLDIDYQYPLPDEKKAYSNFIKGTFCSLTLEIVMLGYFVVVIFAIRREMDVLGKKLGKVLILSATAVDFFKPCKHFVANSDKRFFQVSRGFRQKVFHFCAAQKENGPVVVGYDVNVMNEELDFVNVHTMYLPNSVAYAARFGAQLFCEDSKDDKKNYCVDRSIKMWLEQGLCRQKLVMGETEELVSNQYAKNTLLFFFDILHM